MDDLSNSTCIKVGIKFALKINVRGGERQFCLGKYYVLTELKKT